MNILVIASGTKGYISPFITELYDNNNYLNVEYFVIDSKGLTGYFKNYLRLKELLNKKEYEFDFIHAHYGLSALLPFFLTKIPYIVTFHGSDVFDFKNRFISQIVSQRSLKNILVVSEMKRYIKKNVVVIPCGVNTNIFFKKSEDVIKELKNKYKKSDKKWILFSSSFSRKVKNSELAKLSVHRLGDQYKLIELDGYSRIEVAELMNICDCALLTSHWEGSPQFIKESIACDLPIVSLNVGDVNKVLKEYEKGIICSKDSLIISKKIKQLVNENKDVKLCGLDIIHRLELDIKNIQSRLNSFYKSVYESTH